MTDKPQEGLPFAPQTRGSTFHISMSERAGGVCPADAGVYPLLRTTRRRMGRLPRRRGGLPRALSPHWIPSRFAPQTRGSTLYSFGSDAAATVCPADAGVYPLSHCPQRPSTRLPRTGGGLPASERLLALATPFAPHRRGSTATQGARADHRVVCPAQAGVYLSGTGWTACTLRLPRTGGSLPCPVELSAFTTMFAPHRRGSTLRRPDLRTV